MPRTFPVKQIQLTSSRVDTFHEVRELLCAKWGLNTWELTTQQVATACFQTTLAALKNDGEIVYEWRGLRK